MKTFLQSIKPLLPIPLTHTSLAREVAGNSLDRGDFYDIYQLAEEGDFPYFSYINENDEMELFVVYGDIDEFSKLAKAVPGLEFSARESNWIVMLWLQVTEDEGIGYPFLFDTRRKEKRYEGISFLQQEKVNVYYLAWEGRELWFVYKEEIPFRHHLQDAIRLYLSAYQYDEEVFFEEEEMPEFTLNGEELNRGKWNEEGLSIYLDYGLLEGKYGAEKAREKVMARVYRGIRNLAAYPQAADEKVEFSFWAGERRGLNNLGQETRMVVITLTPCFLEKEDHPLLPLFLYLPEYEKTLRETPGAMGDVPIVSYKNGSVFFYEWNHNE